VDRRALLGSSGNKGAPNLLPEASVASKLLRAGHAGISKVSFFPLVRGMRSGSKADLFT
jgi:hypothetical protein